MTDDAQDKLKSLLERYMQKKNATLRRKNINLNCIDTYPEPDPIDISTFTLTVDMGLETLDTKLFTENVTIAKVAYKGGIVGVSCGNLFRGEKKDKKNNTKAMKNCRMRKRRQYFYNQVSCRLIPTWNDELLPEQVFKDKAVLRRRGVKIFKNGSLHITGAKHEKDAHHIVMFMKQCIIHIGKKLGKDIYTASDHIKKNPGAWITKKEHICIRMIKGRFHTNFPIKRKIVADLLDKKYYLDTEYSPNKYMGVKMRFMYNELNTKNDGICYCNCFREHPEIICDGLCSPYSCGIRHDGGKGILADGNSINGCKSVHLCIFQTGSISITGATSLKQVNTVYQFANTFFKKHFSEIIQLKSDEIINTKKNMKPYQILLSRYDEETVNLFFDTMEHIIKIEKQSYT
ncbi:hypothetical protein COU54_01380 [Candidatus Pacearchaeota archaeon CG10_big_fil_rev_8_21_14_0_10_31_24]|nr:MAG: hypothetical protein COU54_01380 [Candidatus Pacearchaeota archaeon CG10_big_fil_rev_8_21_14_0_10_31_24]